MKLIQVRRADGTDMYVNVEQITHIVSEVNEVYAVHFPSSGGVGIVRVTEEGLNAILDAAQKKE